MSVVVFLSLQACILIPFSLCFPVIPINSVDLVQIPHTSQTKGPHYATVDLQQWQQTEGQPQQSNIIDRAQPHSPSNLGSSHTIPTHPQIANDRKSSSIVYSKPQSDSYKTIAQSVINVINGAIIKTKLQQIKTSNKLQVPLLKSGVLQYLPNHSEVQANGGIKNSKQGREHFAEIPISADDTHTLKLAVQQSLKGEGQQQGFGQKVTTIAPSIAALFALVTVISMFLCCCKKKEQSDENENKNEKQNTTNDTEGVKMTKENKKPSAVFNPSDIPTGEKDLDDHVSVKDKIKAFDSKLIIQPSPDHVAKRKSQIEPNNVVQPQILISDDDVVMRDKSKSKSIGNISKSDTQDDISDKIFDNVSMHSSISQPHNPDVVIADSDEGDEFAELQRGTVILKSFQRAKPPRNRSPATRTSKGKIRKARPNQNRSMDQDKAKSREASGDREPESTPSSLSLSATPGTSLSATPGTSSKTNSLDKSEKLPNKNSLEKSEKTANKNSLEKSEKPANKNSLEKKETSAIGVSKQESAMTKSCDFSDFDSVMTQSVTSIGSDIGNSRKHESPISARYKKSKDSPKSDRKGRTDSPARVTKSKEREIIDKDKEPRTESPSRYKKSKDSPVSKHRQRRRDRDNDIRSGKSDNAMSESVTETPTETQSQPVNRLSGIPANMNNNIFYLIDPTVKSKCKSVGDNLDSKRKSGDFSKRKSGDYNNRKSGDYSKRKSGDFSNRKSGDFGREGAKASKHKTTPSPDESGAKADVEAVSPAKKERISPDPSKQSNDVQDTPL